MADYNEELPNEENDLRIIRDNLSRIDRQRSEETEKRLSHLKDTARLIERRISQYGIKREKAIHWMLSSEEFPQIFHGIAERNPVIETNASVPAFFHDIARAERLYLCKLLIQAYSVDTMRQIWEFLSADFAHDDSISPAADADGKREPEFSGRVIHMKNAYSERAFDSFRPYFSEARVSASGDLQNICEMVYHGRAEYCVLPLENSVDGRLHRFCHMLDQYDLKIVMACNVTSADGDMTTKFGLISRQLKSWAGKWLPGRTYMDCSVILGNQTFLHEILACAEECGYLLHRADAQPIHGDNREYCFHLTFRETEEAVLPLLLLYLQMETVQNTILGIYGYLI